MNRCLLTSERKLITDQHKGTTKVHLGEAVNFIGVTYRSLGEGYLDKWLRTAASPQHGRQLAKAGNPEHTGLPSVSSTGWRASLQVAQLAWAFSRHLGWSLLHLGSFSGPFGWSESVSRQSSRLLCGWGRRDLVNLVSFSDFVALCPTSLQETGTLGSAFICVEMRFHSLSHACAQKENVTFII